MHARQHYCSCQDNVQMRYYTTVPTPISVFGSLIRQNCLDAASAVSKKWKNGLGVDVKVYQDRTSSCAVVLTANERAHVLDTKFVIGQYTMVARFEPVYPLQNLGAGDPIWIKLVNMKNGSKSFGAFVEPKFAVLVQMVLEELKIERFDCITAIRLWTFKLGINPLVPLYGNESQRDWWNRIFFEWYRPAEKNDVRISVSFIGAYWTHGWLTVHHFCSIAYFRPPMDK